MLARTCRPQAAASPPTDGTGYFEGPSQNGTGWVDAIDRLREVRAKRRKRRLLRSGGIGRCVLRFSIREARFEMRRDVDREDIRQERGNHQTKPNDRT